MARRWLTPDDTTTTTAPPTLPPHLPWYQMHGPAAKVAIAGNVIVAVLFFVAIVWRLFFSGTDQEGGRVAGGGVADGDSSDDASTPCASPRAGGLGKEELKALPVYVHGGESAGEGGTGAAAKAECAVCICELRDGDTGRLLPRCGHQFHADCVDRWFRSHATCPLCRDAVTDGGSAEAKASAAQPRAQDL